VYLDTASRRSARPTPVLSSKPLVRGYGPVRVGVLVDLERHAGAGGHVKCWDRFAEAARDFPDDLDLTIHVQGRRPCFTDLAPHVRFVALPPVLSTARLVGANGAPDATDIAPLHPGLLRWLGHYDVIHTTDGLFASARTARFYSWLTGRPLVTSMHTDAAAFARAYAREPISRLVGSGRLARLLLDRYRLPDRLGRAMDRATARHLRRSRWVFVSGQNAPASANDVDRINHSVLRRGIDKMAFHPIKRDRDGLAAAFGVRTDVPLIVFAGRVDSGKRAMTVALVARHLLDRGHDLAVIFAGNGDQRGAIRDLLGAKAVCPGALGQVNLARIYASADVFVFPSRIEITPNVVLEAKASGTPVIVAGGPGGGAVHVRTPGVDGVVMDSESPEIWADAIADLFADDGRRIAMAQAARVDIERNHPSWHDVLAEDLLPVWTRVARRPESFRWSRFMTR